jgi:hypothetical protein
VHHAPERRAGGDDVVDRPSPLLVGRRLERRQVQHLVLPPEEAPQAVLDLVARNRGQEPDRAEVDAGHRDPRAEKTPQRAEHGAVAAEDEGEVGVRRSLFVLCLDELDALLLGELAHAGNGVGDRVATAV